MKNSKIFLLFLCLFLFAQSGLLLGSRRRRRRRKKKVERQEDGRRRRGQRRSNTVDKEAEEEAGEGEQQKGRSLRSSFPQSKKRNLGKKRGRKKRIRPELYAPVGENPPVREDEGYTLTTLGEDEDCKTSIIRFSESDVYQIIYDKNKKHISICNRLEESGWSDKLIENVGHAKHYKIESGRYLFVKTDYCEKFQDYTLKIFDLSIGFGEAVQTIEKIKSYGIALGRYLCVKRYDRRFQEYTLKIFNLSVGFDEVVQTIENVKSFEIALGKYLFVTNNGKNTRHCVLKIFDLSKGSGEAIETIERCRSYKIELKKYVIVEDDFLYTGGVRGKTLRCIRLQIFDASKGLIQSIKPIECHVGEAECNSAIAYKTESEKYLCVLVNCELKIFALSMDVKRPIKTIENVRFRYNIIGNNLIVISDGSEEESQLQIFNLEQLGRAIQQDEEEEGETSNRVEQEYSTAPIFTCVGAVGFKINDGLVSVEFSDGRTELNVFELDGGEVTAPDFSEVAELIGPNFTSDVEGSNFCAEPVGPNFDNSKDWQDEVRVQSVEHNLKDLHQ